MVDTNHYYQRLVNSTFSFHVYRPGKLKTFEAVARLPSIARKPRSPRTMHDFSRTPCYFSAAIHVQEFRATGSFRSATGTSKWNQVRKFSTSSTLPWQKRQVTDLNSLILYSLAVSHRLRRIAGPWSFCHVSVFSLSTSSRGFSTVIFDRRVPNVHVETDWLHSALGCSFNSFSHCSWSK